MDQELSTLRVAAHRPWSEFTAREICVSNDYLGSDDRDLNTFFEAGAAPQVAFQCALSEIIRILPVA